MYLAVVHTESYQAVCFYSVGSRLTVSFYIFLCKAKKALQLLLDAQLTFPCHCIPACSYSLCRLCCLDHCNNSDLALLYASSVSDLSFFVI